MELGLVHKIDIDEEMQQAYLDYAMSVIIARALPDARDGLKPVHRRILYAMHDMGLRPDSSFKKSARIVGEVLGKYHPHGDMAVYDSMARMAQDFSMRYLLIEGQGNFGSVDGDPPAAMRYTEARPAALAAAMLADIEKQTVDQETNFDGTLTEPTVLPAAFPNLLVNGATGIAVGMATSIPPHNLGEVIDALQYVLQHWDRLDDISIDDLMHIVKGPDFPTGGIILQEADSDGLVSAYSTGRGRVTVQANAHLEEMERGRNRIIVSELPYLTNKSTLIERIASLVREERLDGIADLRDESDRQGMRIVIELNKAADPHQVLSELYRSTPMQSTFSIIMLALVDGEPRLLSLKQALRVYVEHRLEIVRRRSQYELERARQREHILAGLRIAIQHLDEVIDLIRKSPNADTARERLMKRFRLSEIQAQAILDMPLKRLAALERKKIEEEYKAVAALIKELEGLLRSPKKMRQVVAEELSSVKEAYADRRRTHIVHLKQGEKKVSMLTASELTPEKLIWVAVTHDGLISRSLEDKPSSLSGKEAPIFYIQANTRDTLYLVDENGEAAAIAVHAIPEASQPSGGTPYNKATALKTPNRLAAVFRLPAKDTRKPGQTPGEDLFVVTATRLGMIKRTAANELPGPSAGSFTLVKVNEGDKLGWVQISRGLDDVLLATASGMAIRFREVEVRAMGLVAAGVMGMKLQPEDELIGMGLLPDSSEVFLLASDGSAKRVRADEFSRQGRYGQGLLAWKLPTKIHVVGMTVGRGDSRIIIHLAKLAAKAIRLDEAVLQTRAARGKNTVEIKAGDQITSITVPWGLVEAQGVATPAKRLRKPATAKAASPRKTETTKRQAAASKSSAGKKPVGTSTTRAKIAAGTTTEPPPNKVKASTTTTKTTTKSRQVEKPTSNTQKKAGRPRSTKSGTEQLSLPMPPQKDSDKTGTKPVARKTTKSSSQEAGSTTTKKTPSSSKSKPAPSTTKSSRKTTTPSKKPGGDGA